MQGRIAMPHHGIYLESPGPPVGCIVTMDVPPGSKGTQTDIPNQHHQEHQSYPERPMKPPVRLWHVNSFSGSGLMPARSLDRRRTVVNIDLLVSLPIENPIRHRDTGIAFGKTGHPLAGL